LAACSHLPQGTDYVPPGPLANVHLLTDDAWSGGDVTVVSTSFKSLTTLPSVQVAGIARAVRRLDDSTIAAQLPDTNGRLSVHLASDSFLPWDATVAVHGYVQLRNGPNLTGRIQATSAAHLVLATGDNGLVEFDANTNSITRQWSETVQSTDCASTVGPSVRPEQYVLAGKNAAGNCGPAGVAVWQYGSALTRTANVPCTSPTYDVFAEIGPGGVVCGGVGSFASSLQISRCSSGLCPTLRVFSNPRLQVTGIAIDPSGRRAVPFSSSSFLIDATTGDSIAPLPFMQSGQMRVTDVAWSAGGDTAYVLADAFGANGGSVVLMMNAVSGARLASVTVPAAIGATAGVAHDPTRPWILVASRFGYATPALAVLDAQTLATIAILKPPGLTAIQTNYCDDSKIVFNQPGAPNAVHIIGTAQSTGYRGFPAFIATFELPPH
jgi:hypothetical protein